MQTAKPSYPFKLTLAERRPFFTISLACFVTSHVVMPSNESIEAVISAYDERIKKIPHLNENGEEQEPPAELVEWITKLMDEPAEYKSPTLEKYNKKDGEPITRGFVVQPKHENVLLKMYRQGLIQLLEPLSHVPVDPQIADVYLKEAKLSFDDFVRFANEIGIEVLVQTDLTALSNAEQQEKPSLVNLAIVESKSSKVDSAPLSPKSNTAMLNVIGGLLEIVLSGKIPKNVNQEWVIKTLQDANPNATGLSKSNLSALFPKAKKSIDGT